MFRPIQITCQGRAKALPCLLLAAWAYCQFRAVAYAADIKKEQAPLVVQKINNPNNAGASEKLELGEMLFFNGNPKAAIKVFKEAIQLNADLYQAHFDLASLYQQMGNLNGAIDEYREIVRLRSKDGDAHFTLGMLLKERGDLNEAITNLKAALALSQGGSADLESTLAFTLLANENLSEALARFDHLLNSGPKVTDPDLILGKAMVLFKMQKVEESLREIDQALSVRPIYPAAHNLKGDLFYAGDKKNEAIQEYCQAIVEDPRFSQAYLSLGNLYLKDKQFTSARDIFQKAERLNPNDKNILYGLAYSLENCGDIKAAIEKFQSVLGFENDPRQRSAVEAHLTELTGH